MNKKKVMVFGTFDNLHLGHLNFFEQAKALGDYLTVVVATDKNVKRIKGRDVSLSQSERIAKIAAEKVVDRVLPGREDFNYLLTLAAEQPDIIALGYDQEPDNETLRAKLDQADFTAIEIIRLNPFQPEIYKSSLIKP